MAEERRKIEIFKPFGEAYERMVTILFRPFDLKKWCVLGFAAFLASFAGGFRTNFNFSSRSDLHSSGNALQQQWANHFGLGDWFWPLVIVLGLILLIVVLVLFWIGCRGQFIFIDGVVRNRAAIIEPWKEFRAEGNRLFGFQLLVGLVFLICLAPFAFLLLWMTSSQNETAHLKLIHFVPLISFLLIFILIVFFWLLLRAFIAPLMYRQRCGATNALKQAWSLVWSHFGACLLFALFFLVVAIGTAIGIFIVMCLTCCLAAIPYVSSVVFLPVSVTYTSFLLFFVRQFGPECDVWQSARALELVPPALPQAELPPPPGDVPPVQG